MQISESDLTETFRRLGAQSPEMWAHSQISEGIPQLARFLFLKEAWSSVTTEGRTNWINSAIRGAMEQPDAPYAGLGVVLSQCKCAGISPEALTEMARCLQAQMLFEIAYLLEGPREDIGVTWGLFATDQNGDPTATRIAGLHESVLETDPTGREMRPKLSD